MFPEPEIFGVKECISSVYAVADPLGGGGHTDPEIRGEARSPKNVFRPLGPHFGRKIRGGGSPGLSSGPATDMVLLNACII